MSSLVAPSKVVNEMRHAQLRRTLAVSATIVAALASTAAGATATTVAYKPRLRAICRS